MAGRTFLACTALALGGCVAAAVNTTTLAVKSSGRDDLRAAAEAGDAVAQYELGKSYCCMGVGFDTQTATRWFCRAARQENRDAMYELGRIYRGDISRTPAPGQKIRRAMSAKTSDAHAYRWLARAAAADHAEAGRLLADLERDISPADRDAAAALDLDWRAAPCEYGEVFPP